MLVLLTTPLATHSRPDGVRPANDLKTRIHPVATVLPHFFFLHGIAIYILMSVQRSMGLHGRSSCCFGVPIGPGASQRTQSRFCNWKHCHRPTVAPHPEAPPWFVPSASFGCDGSEAADPNLCQSFRSRPCPATSRCNAYVSPVCRRPIMGEKRGSPGSRSLEVVSRGWANSIRLEGQLTWVLEGPVCLPSMRQPTRGCCSLCARSLGE